MFFPRFLIHLVPGFAFAGGAAIAAETAPLPRIALGLPVVVSAAPLGVKEWGPWQFPAIQRLPDGRLQIGYHLHADSATAYGLPPGSALSADGGRTWTPDDSGEPPPSWTDRTLILPDGDELHQDTLPSLPWSRVRDRLPAPLAASGAASDESRTIYPADKMPPDLASFHFSRRRAGEKNWTPEWAVVRIPGDVREVVRGRYDSSGGVLTFPWIHRIGLAPDGSLWGIGHSPVIGGRLQAKLGVYFLRSYDGGHTWNLRGEIPYQPVASADPAWRLRDGFTEPNVVWLPDGSLFVLIRTSDGHGVGPLYSARSFDGGKTWSRPTAFDRLGVWPALLRLSDGITLAAYGRPGLYIRATADPAARSWTPRVTVVAPGRLGHDTCSYSDLIALDAHTALIVYSNFTYPDKAGRPRKTILVRRITIL